MFKTIDRTLFGNFSDDLDHIYESIKDPEWDITSRYRYWTIFESVINIKQLISLSLKEK